MADRIRKTPRNTRADLLAEIERLKAVALAMVATDGREFGLVQIGLGESEQFPFRMMICWPSQNAEAELAVAKAFKAYMEEAIRDGRIAAGVNLKSKAGQALEQAWEVLLEAESFLDNPAAFADDFRETGEKLQAQVVDALRLVGPLVVPPRKKQKEVEESGAPNQAFLDARTATTRTKILDAVREHPRSAAAIARAIKISDRTALTYLNAMAEEGVIRMESRGRTSRWVLA